MADLASQLSDWFAEMPDEVKQSMQDALASAVDGEGEADGQVTKAEANYRTADNPDECCATCLHFDGTDRCDRVAGKIDPDHVSDEYEKGGKHDGSGHGTSGGDHRGHDTGASPDSSGADDASGSADTEPDPGDKGDMGE